MVDNAVSSQVKSATRTLDIIEYVVAHDRPLVAQEIAIALGIPVSSLSYLLGTLVERGYLARDGRRYSAGPGLQRLQARRARRAAGAHASSPAQRDHQLLHSQRVGCRGDRHRVKRAGAALFDR